MSESTPLEMVTRRVSDPSAKIASIRFKIASTASRAGLCVAASAREVTREKIRARLCASGPFIPFKGACGGRLVCCGKLRVNPRQFLSRVRRAKKRCSRRGARQSNERAPPGPRDPCAVSSPGPVRCVPWFSSAPEVGMEIQVEIKFKIMASGISEGLEFCSAPRRRGSPVGVIVESSR
jgi:hypothetical protein